MRESGWYWVKRDMVSKETPWFPAEWNEDFESFGWSTVDAFGRKTEFVMHLLIGPRFYPPTEER